MKWSHSMLLLIARTCLRCERLLIEQFAKDELNVMAHNDERVRLFALAKEAC